MILSKFINNTFKAAKKSALQIYGDDYSKLMDMMPEEEKNDENNPSDKRKRQQHESTNKNRPMDRKTTRGVVFERSANTKRDSKHSPDKKLEKKLESIRKYAAQQAEENTRETFDKSDASADAEPSSTTDKKGSTPEQPLNNVYSRKDIRQQNSSTDKKSPNQEFDTVTLNNMEPPSEYESEPLYDKFVEELPNGV
ncbi:MAG: hypothetical protein GWN00_38945, partial [Aliifodinibius sp.]|nr:hypothetical protein [Fodinibius sp.]NIV16572.1 hypothetical protein [Fodinibius sp.]NIY30543.1 hypothetical protein [Fodinibius sp.]